MNWFIFIFHNKRTSYAFVIISVALYSCNVNILNELCKNISYVQNFSTDFQQSVLLYKKSTK
nr:MAG TPA: Sly1 Protein [Caudoviricetes sp.]